MSPPQHTTGGATTAFSVEPHPSSSALLRLAVSGMSCTSCESAVRRALLELPAVQEAIVSKKTSSALVTLSSHSSFPPGPPIYQAIIDAVAAAGSGRFVATIQSSAFSSSSSSSSSLSLSSSPPPAPLPPASSSRTPLLRSGQPSPPPTASSLATSADDDMSIAPSHTAVEFSSPTLIASLAEVPHSQFPSSEPRKEQTDVITKGSSNTVRRYRCGCARVRCICSHSPVIPGDAGVLVLLSEPIDDCSSCCRPDAFSDTASILTPTDCAATTNLPAIITTSSPLAASSGPPHPPPITIRIPVHGMTCMSCTGRVSAALAEFNQGDLLDKPPIVDFLGASVILLVRAVGADPIAVAAQACRIIRNAGYRAQMPPVATSLLGLDSRLRADTLFLSFSDIATARRAASILHKSGFVQHVRVCTDRDASGTSIDPHPVPGRLSGDMEDDGSVVLDPLLPGTPSSSFSIPQPADEEAPDDISQSRNFVRRWVIWDGRSARRDNGQVCALQVIPKPFPGANIKIAVALDKLGMPFSVVSNGYSGLSGTRDPSANLRTRAREYRRLFLISLVLSFPVFVLNMVLMNVPVLARAFKANIGYSAISIVAVASWILATPVQFYCGFKFYRGSWFALKARRPNMDMLVALGTSIAYFYSVTIVLVSTVLLRTAGHTVDEPTAFETSTLLITIVLLGQWLETLAKSRAASSVAELAGLQPTRADVVSSPPDFQFIANVDVNMIVVGDFVRVIAGSTFPVDSIIVQGETVVDESMLTGESLPVPKAVGDAVYAGAMNGNGSVIVRCTAVGQEATLAKIISLVQSAQAAKAPIERFADRISSVFVPLVMILALLTTVVWFILAEANAVPKSWYSHEGTFLFALLFGMSVLVIACPCALGIATSTVVMVTTGTGAKKLGILFKGGGEALQALRKVSTVLFDKTGTLTVGKAEVTTQLILETIDTCLSGIPRSVSLASVPDESFVNVEHNGVTETIMNEKEQNDVAGMREAELLSAILAVECLSDHPLAAAISSHVDMELRKRSMRDGTGPAIPAVRFHESHAGSGVSCSLTDGRVVRVGRPSWILSNCKDSSQVSVPITLKAQCQEEVSAMEVAGKTVVFASVDHKPLIAFGIEDAVRPEAKNVIFHLKSQGVQCGMVTGDSEHAAYKVADAVGIERDHVVSRALPFDKVNTIQTAVDACRSSKNSGSVVFVGDGINDAAALAAADVGIALGTGSQIASESASIVLVRSNFEDVAIALDLGRRAFRRIVLNYTWALLYNVICIPIAAGLFYPLIHVRLPPYLAAAAMGASSISVVLSSLALKFYSAEKTFEESTKEN